VDIRYLPGQDPDAILAAIAELPDVSVDVVFRRAPAIVARDNPHVHALAATVSRWTPEDRISIGRDGASDANSFLDAGTPAVEFGPVGGGHHGPDEWVSVESLAHYREALVDFVTSLPQALGKGHLRIA
jgi:succinyl-diaminopimelate desuccinylase